MYQTYTIHLSRAFNAHIGCYLTIYDDQHQTHRSYYSAIELTDKLSADYYSSQIFITSYFPSLYFSLFLLLGTMVLWPVLIYRGVHFSSSMCQTNLMIIAVKLCLCKSTVCYAMVFCIYKLCVLYKHMLSQCEHALLTIGTLECLFTIALHDCILVQQ